MDAETTQAGDAAGAETAANEVVNQPAGESPEAEKPKKTFTQEDLDRMMTRERRSWERKHDRVTSELKGRIDELSKRQSASTTNSSGDEPLAAPKREDFSTYEDFLEAKSDYRAELKLREWQSKQQKQQEKEQAERTTADTQKQLAKQANERIAAGREEFPDFDQVIRDAFDDGVLEQDTELYFGIIESPVGHRIAHHLANHPDEAERIGKLSPRGIHRELGKLEDKFSKAPEKKKPETMETLNASGRVIKPNDPMREDMSMDDYVRVRNEQERKRRGY